MSTFYPTTNPTTPVSRQYIKTSKVQNSTPLVELFSQKNVLEPSTNTLPPELRRNRLSKREVVIVPSPVTSTIVTHRGSSTQAQTLPPRVTHPPVVSSFVFPSTSPRTSSSPRIYPTERKHQSNTDSVGTLSPLSTSPFITPSPAGFFPPPTSRHHHTTFTNFTTTPRATTSTNPFCVPEVVRTSRTTANTPRGSSSPRSPFVAPHYRCNGGSVPSQFELQLSSALSEIQTGPYPRVTTPTRMPPPVAMDTFRRSGAQTARPASGGTAGPPHNDTTTRKRLSFRRSAAPSPLPRGGGGRTAEAHPAAPLTARAVLQSGSERSSGATTSNAPHHFASTTTPRGGVHDRGRARSSLIVKFLDSLKASLGLSSSAGRRQDESTGWASSTQSYKSPLIVSTGNDISTMGAADECTPTTIANTPPALSPSSEQRTATSPSVSVSSKTDGMGRGATKIVIPVLPTDRKDRTDVDSNGGQSSLRRKGTAPVSESHHPSGSLKSSGHKAGFGVHKTSYRENKESCSASTGHKVRKAVVVPPLNLKNTTTTTTVSQKSERIEIAAVAAKEASPEDISPPVTIFPVQTKDETILNDSSCRKYLTTNAAASPTPSTPTTTASPPTSPAPHPPSTTTAASSKTIRFSWKVARALVKLRMQPASTFSLLGVPYESWELQKIPTLGASPTSCRVQEMYKATIVGSGGTKRVFVKRIPIAIWQKQYEAQNKWNGEYVTDGENFVMEAAALAFLQEYGSSLAPSLLGILELSLPSKNSTTTTTSRTTRAPYPKRHPTSAFSSSSQQVTHVVIVSELYGEDLLDFLDRREKEHRPLVAEEKRKLQLDCLTLLRRLHYLGFAHLDFTPENVLYGSKGLRLCDFAKATPLWTYQHRHVPPAHQRPRQSSGMMSSNFSTWYPFESCEPTVGKGAYMPPECWKVYWKLEDTKVQFPLEELWSLPNPHDRSAYYFRVCEADVYMLGVLMFWIWSEGGIWKCSDPRQDDKYSHLLKSGLNFDLFRECRSWPPELKDALQRALRAEPWRRATLDELVAHPWFQQNATATTPTITAEEGEKRGRGEGTESCRASAVNKETQKTHPATIVGG